MVAIVNQHLNSFGIIIEKDKVCLDGAAVNKKFVHLVSITGCGTTDYFLERLHNLM